MILLLVVIIQDLAVPLHPLLQNVSKTFITIMIELNDFSSSLYLHLKMISQIIRYLKTNAVICCLFFFFFYVFPITFLFFTMFQLAHSDEDENSSSWFL